MSKIDDLNVLNNQILSFSLDNERDDDFMINIKTNNPIKDIILTINNEELEFTSLNDTEFRYLLNGMPNLKEEIKALVRFKNSDEITSRCSLTNLYKSNKFIKEYTYNGELGAIYSPSKTTFRVWSPISKNIILRIYNNGTPLSLDSKIGSDDHKDFNMYEIENGCYECVVDGDLGGKYYTYIVNNYRYSNMEIPDPSCKSCGINGIRSMVVDFSKTNPEGWDDVKLNGLKDTELMVYETHIADLTSSKTWGGSSENQRTYVGFYEEGTTYTLNGITVKTGFDHIKELGVNTVQLLPIFKHGADERKDHIVFNWGYDPTLYNSLDGVYGKNPYDGYEKIKEFKNLVMAYSKAGINIIMDVVYNHMFEIKENPFEILMPEYYFRYDGSRVCDGSACGNETASDKPMFRKFMIDSTEFWAKEYKLGGFRFDLMGLHDIETMSKLSANLKANVNPRITVYGEPWNAGSVNLGYGEAAVQYNMNKYVGFGCFNDKERDALIKGGICDSLEKGWVNQDSIKLIDEMDSIKAGIKGQIISTNDKLEVEKCVNYVTCHDNYTLYDRFKAAGETDDNIVKKMAILAQSVSLTSEGINFMLAGEEFLRTKNGNDNSYNTTFLENELNYSLKVKHLDLFKLYQKLIKLHNETNLFNKNSNECKDIKVYSSDNNNVIYYDLKDNNKLFRIAHRNAYMDKEEVNIDFEGFKLYLDTINSKIRLTKKTNLEAYQTIIAYKEI